MRIPRIFWEGLLWLNLAIILFYWWQGSGSLVFADITGSLIAFGRLSGLLAVYTVLLQFVFMGRTPWVERTFGLDKLARIHHTNGKLTLFFILLHPLLLTAGYSLAAGINPWVQFKSFLFDYEHVFFAGIGALLFVVVVICSLVIVRSRLRYESWYFVHLLVYVAVFASFWHQLEVGTDLLSSQVFYWYWIALYSVVLVNHVLFRFLRPVYLYYRHDFVVSRIERETHNAVSIYIKGKNLESFPIYPGQFMIFRFFTKGLWWQAHPFSLSYIPRNNELRITVKELGDFTKQLHAVQVGTNVLIDGPYGIFTEWVRLNPKVLFIAGGIGITPIRSLMEQMVTQDTDAVLLYANRTQNDIVFKDELDQIAKRPNAEIVLVLSDDPEYAGETGKLERDRIQRLVPDISTRDVYLCGPVPMMDALIEVLRQLGVPKSHIHYEKFSL